MDESIYEFVNFETHEVIEDLEYFLAELAQINPAAKVIFTVSPVPLVATYEDRHVLISTTYSKSALRSAADYIVRRYPQAEYFPSYEIITGNYIKSAYYESDLRSVREEGVSHVMRLFMEHYSSEVTHATFMELDEKQLNAAAKNNAVICDEEALDSN
ncbi:GSCFA family protein [compost metagenome]